MGYQKLTGAKAILGGAVVLTSPTIYANLSTSTSGFKIYGTPTINASATDATKGGISLGGATRYIKKIAFTAANLQNTSNTTSYHTGWAIPTSGVVTDAWFQITSVGSSVTLRAGTTGAVTGFLTGVATTPAGVHVGTIDNGGVTYGTLLTGYAWSTCDIVPARVNYAPRALKYVHIGRSATNLELPAGNLFIEYIVPGA